MEIILTLYITPPASKRNCLSTSQFTVKKIHLAVERKQTLFQVNINQVFQILQNETRQKRRAVLRVYLFTISTQNMAVFSKTYLVPCQAF